MCLKIRSGRGSTYVNGQRCFKRHCSRVIASAWAVSSLPLEGGDRASTPFHRFHGTL